MDQPRAHHYYFAYRALPGIVSQLGRDFIAKVKDFNDDNWFKIWNDIGKELEVEQRISHQGLTAKYVKRDKYEGIAISLPEPKIVPEAYYIFIIQKRNRFPFLNKNITPRYFTLELGSDPLSHNKRAVFCELSGSTHKNLGEGPEPDPEKFISFVEKYIQ